MRNSKGQMAPLCSRPSKHRGRPWRVSLAVIAAAATACAGCGARVSSSGSAAGASIDSAVVPVSNVPSAGELVAAFASPELVATVEPSTGLLGPGATFTVFGHGPAPVTDVLLDGVPLRAGKVDAAHLGSQYVLPTTLSAGQHALVVRQDGPKGPLTTASAIFVPAISRQVTVPSAATLLPTVERHLSWEDIGYDPSMVHEGDRSPATRLSSGIDRVAIETPSTGNLFVVRTDGSPIERRTLASLSGRAPIAVSGSGLVVVDAAGALDVTSDVGSLVPLAAPGISGRLAYLLRQRPASSVRYDPGTMTVYVKNPADEFWYRAADPFVLDLTTARFTLSAVPGSINVDRPGGLREVVAVAPRSRLSILDTSCAPSGSACYALIQDIDRLTLLRTSVNGTTVLATMAAPGAITAVNYLAATNNGVVSVIPRDDGIYVASF